jgi:hypothetical protein
MSTAIDKNRGKEPGKPPEKLATDGPLAEKDEQGKAIEHSRKLAKEALEQWHGLKEKITHPFKSKVNTRQSNTAKESGT